MKNALTIAVLCTVIFALAFTACDNVANLIKPELTGSVSLDKPSPKTGEEITASYNAGNGTGEQTWQWFRVDNTKTNLIQSATNDTYIATAEDEGKIIGVQLSFSERIGSVSATTEDIVVKAPVVEGNPGDSGAPSDTTAPLLSSGSVSRTSDTAATIGFTTNEAGTAYYSVQNSGAAAPTNAAIKTSLGAVSSGAVSGKSVPLTAGAKDIYVVVQDAAGNISAPLKIQAAAYAPPLPAPITDVSPLLGNLWFKYKNPDFKFVFKNNGTISVLHCCDLEFTDQISYLYYDKDKILITYGTDDDVVKTAGFRVQTSNPLSSDNKTLTIGSGTEKDFYRGSATGKLTYLRGDAPYADYQTGYYGNSNYTESNSSPNEPLVLSNNLLGTWGGTGTEYKFSSNAELMITGSGAGQYIYLVRVDRLVTYGPINGTGTKSVKEYTFTRSGNSLTLKPTPSGSTITLSLK